MAWLLSVSRRLSEKKYQKFVSVKEKNPIYRMPSRQKSVIASFNFYYLIFYSKAEMGNLRPGDQMWSA